MLHGMDYADSTDPHRQLDGSCYWVSDGFFGMLVDAILAQIKRAGFKFVFADGHGPSRRAWREAMTEREQRFGLKLAGVTDEVARGMAKPDGPRRAQRNVAGDALPGGVGGSWAIIGRSERVAARSRRRRSARRQRRIREGVHGAIRGNRRATNCRKRDLITVTGDRSRHLQKDDA